ncbi:MAG: hypothetical protein AAF711_00550 [Planctomycetota bacterium]
MVTLQDAPPAPATVSKDIYVKGRKIGTVTHCDHGHYSNWHAVIDMDLPDAWQSSLAQGHGDDPEEAIANAVTQSREQARAYLAELERLAAEMFPG